MKRYCKNIRLDKDWIMACMLECFSDKWKRRDVAGFLAGYQTGQPLSVRAVSRLIQEKRRVSIESKIHNRTAGSTLAAA